MTPALLREIGEALYGPRWKADLGEALGVDPRSIRHWISGARPIPEDVGPQVVALLRKRHTTAGRLLERLAA